MAKKTTSSTPTAKPSVKVAASAKPAPKHAIAAKIEEVAPAPPAKAAVVTLKQLAAQFGDSHEMPAKQAQAMLDSVVGLIVDHLKAGDKLRLAGLGILEVKDRPAPAGRNAATGEARGSWARSRLGAAALARALIGAFARFLEPVGLTLDGNDLGVVDQTIDQRYDASGIGKHLTPLGERPIGGDQGATILVAAGDQLEHQVGMAVGIR